MDSQIIDSINLLCNSIRLLCVCVCLSKYSLLHSRTEICGKINCIDQKLCHSHLQWLNKRWNNDNRIEWILAQSQKPSQNICLTCIKWMLFQEGCVSVFNNWLTHSNVFWLTTTFFLCQNVRPMPRNKDIQLLCATARPHELYVFNRFIHSEWHHIQHDQATITHTIC